jgi:cell wall-associated NlpC family hydrolase
LKDQGFFVSIHPRALLRRAVLLGAAAIAAVTVAPAPAFSALSARASTLPALSARASALPALSAQASASAAASAAYAARMRGYHVVAAAKAQIGKPYRFGAAGPGAFDCSGLTGYAYRSVRISLPRTADGQFRAARPVAKAAARPGDLVFWVSGGHAYHVAVYAGGGRVWHAPKPEQRVQLTAIWSWGQVRFGRIG